jgi:hypothetical protein
MEKLHLKIIENCSSNTELLLDYWRFDDNYKYSYTINDLLKKYEVISPNELLKKVRKAGFLEVKKIKVCNLCYEEYKANDRPSFKYLQLNFLKKEISCAECEKSNALKMTKKLISNLNTDIKIKDESHQFKKLSYLENIYLYVLIENYIKNKGIVKSWNYNTVVRTSGGGEVVDNIIKKGYIQVREGSIELSGKQAKLRSIYMKYSNFFDHILIKEVEKTLKLNFDSESIILIPSEFNCLEDWIVEILKTLQKEMMTIEDIREVEKFLFNKRFWEISVLIDQVCLRNHIKINKNNAFDFVLIGMAKKYNLETIYNILNYQAIKTTSNLDKYEHFFEGKFNYINSNLYIRNIENFLNRIEIDANRTLYTKQLPIDWEYSELEFFVANNIIKNNQKWDKFIPSEILALWVESAGIRDEI